MAEFLAELEKMAANAATDQTACEVEASTIERWQNLFGLSHDQATLQITRHRLYIGRLRIQDELWNSIKMQQETRGFDRESFEYSLQQVVETSKITATQSLKHSLPLYQQDLHTGSAKKVYILKLDGPISQAETVQKIAHLDHTPEIFQGVGSENNEAVIFCKINAATRQKIIGWVREQCSSYRPTIVRLSMASKALSAVTMEPALGIETTLPQYRPTQNGLVPLPAQDEHPVWYFFYGNLAKSNELQCRLGLTEPPVYVPAYVQGAVIRSWRGQYQALVNADSPSCRVVGSAYLVNSKAHEDTLRFYETEKYEVVRCKIFMRGLDDLPVDGLVFRFASFEDELI